MRSVLRGVGYASNVRALLRNLGLCCGLLVLLPVGLAQEVDSTTGVAVRRVRGARTARTVHRQLMRARHRLALCQSPMCGEVTAAVEIDSAGALVVRRTRLSDRDEQRTAGQCVTRTLEGLEFGPAESSTSLRVVVTLSGCLPASAPRR